MKEQWDVLKEWHDAARNVKSLRILHHQVPHLKKEQQLELNKRKEK